jgi:hypothetical protein
MVLALVYIHLYIKSDGRNKLYQVIPIPTWILVVTGFNLGLGTTVSDSGFLWSMWVSLDESWDNAFKHYTSIPFTLFVVYHLVLITLKFALSNKT